MLGNDRILRMAPTLGVVEIASGIGLEVHGEFMEVLGNLRVIVEILVMVGLSIAVQVSENGDLVAAQHIDGFIYDLEPERLEQAGCDSLPGELSGLCSHAVNQPHVAHPGAGRGAPAIGKEVKAAQAHPGFPGVLHGRGQDVDCKGAVVGAEPGLGLEFFFPARRSAFRQGREVGGLARIEGRGVFFKIRGRSLPDRELESPPGLVA